LRAPGAGVRFDAGGYVGTGIIVVMCVLAVVARDAFYACVGGVNVDGQTPTITNVDSSTFDFVFLLSFYTFLRLHLGQDSRWSL
jgi:hypothetical protein